MFHAVVDDDIVDAAAMLAFYAVIAIFPMLVFVGTLALLVVPAATLHQGVAMATEALPLGVRDLLNTRVDALVAGTAHRRGRAHAGIRAVGRFARRRRVCRSRSTASSASAIRDRGCAVSSSRSAPRSASR